MSLNFVIPEMQLNGAETPPLQFFRRGFLLNGTAGSGPSWQNIVLSGNGSLTLTNAKANGINYLKLFGGTEQTGTPTPTVPVDIVCNNGAIKYSLNMANVNAQTALVGYYISNSGVVMESPQNWIYQDYIPVEPSTTYTLTMSSPVYYVTISEYKTADDTGFSRRNAGSTGGNTTLTITTRSTTNYIRFGANIDSSDVTLDKVFSINWMLNKGNSMPYAPYSEDGIYTDGTVETVEVYGKNLFNKNNAQVGKNWNGNNMAYSIASDYIPAKKGDVFTLSVSDMPKYTSTTWAVLDSDYTYLGAVSNGSAITQDTCAYIKLSIRCASTDSWTQSDLDNAKIQLEIGSTATTYEPYFNGGSATAEMLLKVGDYQDEQNVTNGHITRNVEIKVLDGTEDWGSKDTYGRTQLPISNIAQGGSPRTIPSLCTHYQNLHNGEPIADVTSGQFYIATGGLYFHISQATTADFKTWLANQYANGTPVIVVYPLKNSTTESVAHQHLGIQAGSNAVEITQASINNLPLEVSYKGTV